MYLLQGKMNAQTDKSNELSQILLEASKLVSTAKGCKLYLIAKDEHDTDDVYVTAIWESKEDHDHSLNMPGVRQLIIGVMPHINGQPTIEQELEALGWIRPSVALRIRS